MDWRYFARYAIGSNVWLGVLIMNEPVAWMSNGEEFYVQKNYCPDFIPLYTHPVKEQLTDEEMLEIYKKFLIKKMNLKKI